MWRWTYALRARLRALVRPERSDHELNDELSFHVAMQTQANLAKGLTRAEAERQARLALGGVQQLKEKLHDRRSVSWFEHLRQDVRYGVRTILRTKVVSAAIIVTFALGIGANAAIFSLINSVLLSPLPYDSPDRIVTVETFWTNTGQANTVSSAPDFRDWREQNHVFDYMAFHAGREARVVANGTPIFASLQRLRCCAGQRTIVDSGGGVDTACRGEPRVGQCSVWRRVRRDWQDDRSGWPGCRDCRRCFAALYVSGRNRHLDVERPDSDQPQSRRPQLLRGREAQAGRRH